MNFYPIAERTINRLTTDLYPRIEKNFQSISSGSLNKCGADGTENLFEIFNDLKAEFESLMRYETKLVFPRLEKYFTEKGTGIPQNVYVSEVYDLMKRKEECIKEMMLLLEVEIQADNEALQPFANIVELFNKEYFPTKQEFYKTIRTLQREKVSTINDNFDLPNILMN